MNEEQKLKAEEAVRRRRAELVRRLTICTGARSLQFDPVMVEDLDRTIEMCLMLGSDDKTMTWDALVVARDDRKRCKAVIAMLERSSPLPLPGPLADLKKDAVDHQRQYRLPRAISGQGKDNGQSLALPRALDRGTCARRAAICPRGGGT